MPSKPRIPGPKETIKIRRLPKEGEETTLRARVTRTGRNGHDTADTVTVAIPGYSIPVTLDAAYLGKADDE
jgi:hypothetical protein